LKKDESGKEKIVKKIEIKLSADDLNKLLSGRDKKASATVAKSETRNRLKLVVTSNRKVTFHVSYDKCCDP
jgi:hypothetical protein